MTIGHLSGNVSGAVRLTSADSTGRTSPVSLETGVRLSVSGLPHGVPFIHVTPTSTSVASTSAPVVIARTFVQRTRAVLVRSAVTLNSSTALRIVSALSSTTPAISSVAFPVISALSIAAPKLRPAGSDCLRLPRRSSAPVMSATRASRSVMGRHSTRPRRTPRRTHPVTRVGTLGHSAFMADRRCDVESQRRTRGAIRPIKTDLFSRRRIAVPEIVPARERVSAFAAEASCAR